jgi:RNA polymerase sigma-70 factor (ECF subfamily)
MAAFARPDVRYLHRTTIAGNNYCEKTFASLYIGYRDTVFQAALRITRNPSDAEDVVQNVFLRMLQNDAQPDPRRSPAAYLRRAAANASIDLIRQRAQRGETTLPQHYPAEQHDWLVRRQVRQAIEKLPPPSASLFVLHYQHGYLCAELAHHFGVEGGTVKSRLHRIRAALRKQLRAA